MISFHGSTEEEDRERIAAASTGGQMALHSSIVL
jgi:hypothetical protein